MIRKYVVSLVLPDQTMWYVTGNVYQNKIVLTNDIKGATKFLTTDKASSAGKSLRDSIEKDSQDMCQIYVIPYGKTPGDKFEIKRDIITEICNEMHIKSLAQEANNG